MNYDNPTSSSTGFTLSPSANTNQPWIVPRGAIYSSGGVDESTYWARTRDVVPGCTSQTISPSTGPTCAPGAAYGTLTVAGLSVNYPKVASVPLGILNFIPLTITNSQASGTPNPFQVMVTVDSATYSQYEAANLQNIEFFTAAGAVLPSWLRAAISTLPRAPSTG